ncbi:ABC-type lipoprotein export system ATPase subunit [Roseiarcus fermentans]|uniref:ABC-type lipoprotein export system ATPase subunit n=1 Tax=Roseiarcus fermentans TaxID=1473586 RepID=A0A366FV67_9HYPH|nr:ABC transporter ATP-binding protein [Roseiarcus fermentans]RBP18401.1 ABC-type lipoprotein export system ATPase subunit [Roseiarcus fermentans]
MLISAQDISRRYGAADLPFFALRPTSLEIEAGAFVAVVGASGSGKSTLMALLGLLDRPSSGRLLFEGRETTALRPDATARIRNRRIGFIFQQYHLLARMTVLRNVELPLVYAGESPRNRRRRAEAALESVGLTAKFHAMPANLSGGEQQRVAIARAIAADPVLLLADEPTGALDSTSGEGVLGLIEALNAQGRTVVMVTHDSGVAARARRVIRMRDGEIVSDGPADPETRHPERAAS